MNHHQVERVRERCLKQQRLGQRARQTTTTSTNPAAASERPQQQHHKRRRRRRGADVASRRVKSHRCCKDGVSALQAQIRYARRAQQTRGQIRLAQGNSGSLGDRVRSVMLLTASVVWRQTNLEKFRKENSKRQEEQAEQDTLAIALQYRDRAKERRKKYGTPEPPSPTYPSSSSSSAKPALKQKSGRSSYSTNEDEPYQSSSSSKRPGTGP